MKSWALAGMFISSLAALAACDGGDDGGEGGFGTTSSTSTTMTGSGGAGGGTGGSTSTTMTGSGGAGGGGTGGSATVCDQTTMVCNDGNPNTTTDCSGCAIAPGALCRPLAVSCSQNADCAALDTCLSQCAPGDTVCINNCDTMHPNGVTAHDVLEECIFCQACPTVCDDPICMQ